MELAVSDIRRLERCGLRIETFAKKCEDGFTRLQNARGRCCLYDASKKRCRIYRDRPQGCRIYPVIYSEEEGFKIDESCPKRGTVGAREFALKSRVLRALLGTLESETNVPINLDPRAHAE